jgi:hypothetical protein
MFKRIDAFAKPREDLRQKSALGGFITLVASIAAGILFVGQLYTYFTGVTRHSLHLSKSEWHPVPKLDRVGLTGGGRIPLKMHISFPHLTCSRLDLTHDGMSFKDEKFRETHSLGVSAKVTTRSLTETEWRQSTGITGKKPTQTDLHQGCSFVASYYVAKVGGAFTVGLSAAAWHEASTFLIMGLDVFNRANQKKSPSGGMFNTT